MDNNSKPMWCGIDVSEAELAVCAQDEAGAREERAFANRASGHQQLLRWLNRLGGQRQSLSRSDRDLFAGRSVSAQSCRSGSGSAESQAGVPLRRDLRRSKTDAADAQVPERVRAAHAVAAVGSPFPSSP